MPRRAKPVRRKFVKRNHPGLIRAKVSAAVSAIFPKNASALEKETKPKKPSGFWSSHPWFCFTLFFLVPYLLFSFFTYRDYGITIDEPQVYRDGLYLKNYLLTNQGFMCSFPSYNYLHVAILSLFNPMGFEKWHLYNLLFASLIFIIIFELLWVHYRNVFWALGGPWALFLTPGFLGSIPANPKDVPFAVYYFISLGFVYLTRLWFKGEWPRVLILGTIFAVTTCNRTVGFTLFVILFLFDLIEHFIIPAGNGKKGWASWFTGETVKLISTFVVSQFWMAAFYPYLRQDYFNHFLDILKAQAKLNINVTDGVLFMGKIVSIFSYPWYYLPVWLLVTLPVFTVIFFYYFFRVLREMLKKNPKNSLALLFSVAFLFNFLVYLAVKPIIYDGTRHLTYLIPIMTFMAYMAVVHFFQKKHSGALKQLAAAFLVANSITVGIHMVRLHPYEYIYFNELIGGLEGANGNFETDYWNAGFKEAVQWLMDNKTNDPKRNYMVKTDCNLYFPRNIILANNAYRGDDWDYTFQLTRRGETVPKELVPNIIHTVQREGVGLVYILKRQ